MTLAASDMSGNFPMVGWFGGSRVSGSGALNRQLKAKGRALALGAFKNNCTTLVLNYPLSQVQPQPGAVGADILGVASPVKLGKQVLLSVGRHPDASIANFHPEV